MEAEDDVNKSGFSSFVRRDVNYRTTALLDSDDSDSSDSNDDNIWSSKRSRITQAGKQEKPFVNPNIQGQLAVQGPCSPVKKFRKNNIWGSILQEQTVSEGLSRRIQVDHDSDIDSDNVESYNYKCKFQDTRPENKTDSEDNNIDERVIPSHHHLSFVEKETFGTIENKNRKRSHSSRSAKDRLGRGNVKERIGERSFDKNKKRPHITVFPTDSTAKIVNELVNVLNEPKVELMTRVVETLGPEKSIELLYMTEDIEEAGGMMINNGSRRRTRGGVFLQLIRSDPDIERETVLDIFKEERDNTKKLQRRRKLRQKQWIAQQVLKAKADSCQIELEEQTQILNKENQNEMEEMVTESKKADVQGSQSVNGDGETQTKEKLSDLEEGEISD